MITKLSRWGLPYSLVWATGVAWDATAADATVHYADAETVGIDEPPFPDADGTAGEYAIPPRHVGVYDDATLLGHDDPVALTRTGTPIGDVARDLRFETLRQVRDAGRHAGWLTTAAELLAPRLSRLEPDVALGAVVPFTRRSPEINYYHWLTEYLPRLRGVEAYAEAVGARPTLLLESEPPSWVLESLRLAGVSDDDWRAWEGTSASADRLVVPAYTRKGFPRPFEPSRSDLSWVRDRLCEAAPSPEASTHDRIFVSRADATERRLENRDAVVTLLEEYDFEVVVPSEHDVAEQVALFREADTIAGPHGAGLTNALFARDATLVECFPANYTPAYFYAIAQLFDLDYQFVVGSGADPDFSVPVDALAATLEELF